MKNDNVVIVLLFTFGILLMFAVLINSLSVNETPRMHEFHPMPNYSQYHSTHQENHQQKPVEDIMKQHHVPTLCDANLRKEPRYTVDPSTSQNEHPQLVNYHSHCQIHPKANPELAAAGTGVGVPAFEDVNEFPAPYLKDDKLRYNKSSAKFFNVLPRDEFDETNDVIDYKVNMPPVSGLACQRPSGLGEPAFEKENEFPAPYRK